VVNAEQGTSRPTGQKERLIASDQLELAAQSNQQPQLRLLVLHRDRGYGRAFCGFKHLSDRLAAQREFRSWPCAQEVDPRFLEWLGPNDRQSLFVPASDVLPQALRWGIGQFCNALQCARQHHDLGVSPSWTCRQ